MFFFKKTVNTFTSRMINISQYSFNTELKLNYIYLYLRNSWITYRYFFGYSKFGRTRSNSNSVKNTSIFFKKVLLATILKRYFLVFNFKNKLTAVYLEFFNKLWFFQWNSIWESANSIFMNFVKLRGKRLTFGLNFAIRNKAFTFIKKKLKPNRKKTVLPSNVFNIGFYFMFTSVIRKAVSGSKKFKITLKK